MGEQGEEDNYSLSEPSDVRGVQSSCAKDMTFPNNSNEKEQHVALMVDEDDTERDSISTTDTPEVADAAHRREVLAWFEAELANALGDTSAAGTLTTCLEVVLSDEVSSRDEIVENVLAIGSVEGVPEELALELMRRW